MITCDTKIRIIYRDTDKMGVVYHGNYIAFYEAARTELFRSVGLIYAKMEEEGVMTPILEVESKYLIPIFYDELITVRAIIDQMPMARLTIKYEVYNQEGKLANTGQTILGFVNSTTHHPCRAPKHFYETLQNYFE